MSCILDRTCPSPSVNLTASHLLVSATFFSISARKSLGSFIRPIKAKKAANSTQFADQNNNNNNYRERPDTWEDFAHGNTRITVRPRRWFGCHDAPNWTVREMKETGSKQEKKERNALCTILKYFSLCFIPLRRCDLFHLPHAIVDIIVVESNEEAKDCQKYNNIACDDQASSTPLNL